MPCSADASVSSAGIGMSVFPLKKYTRSDIRAIRNTPPPAAAPIIIPKFESTGEPLAAVVDGNEVDRGVWVVVVVVVVVSFVVLINEAVAVELVVTHRVVDEIVGGGIEVVASCVLVVEGLVVLDVSFVVVVEGLVVLDVSFVVVVGIFEVDAIAVVML